MKKTLQKIKAIFDIRGTYLGILIGLAVIPMQRCIDTCSLTFAWYPTNLLTLHLSILEPMYFVYFFGKFYLIPSLIGGSIGWGIHRYMMYKEKVTSSGKNLNFYKEL